MKTSIFSGVLGATTIAAMFQGIIGTTLSAPPHAAAAVRAPAPIAMASAAVAEEDLRPQPVPTRGNTADLKADLAALPKDQMRIETLAPVSAPVATTTPAVAKPDFSYLADYAYAEVLPDEKPADTVLKSMQGIPVGTPLEEIKRVSELFGLDFVFMRAVAKIESGLDPRQRTGSYIGLYQLSRSEFKRYGSGNILDPRDNAVAAAYKILIEAKLFELDTHKKPTLSDLYLIHQQGLEGAAEHISHPDRIAWKSMCATEEGRDKGERWCKRAIWGNTLPVIKRAWKSVDKLTSRAFVAMWQERVNHFYTRYSEASADK